MWLKVAASFFPCALKRLGCRGICASAHHTFNTRETLIVGLPRGSYPFQQRKQLVSRHASDRLLRFGRMDVAKGYLRHRHAGVMYTGSGGAAGAVALAVAPSVAA